MEEWNPYFDAENCGEAFHVGKRKREFLIVMIVLQNAFKKAQSAISIDCDALKLAIHGVSFNQNLSTSCLSTLALAAHFKVRAQYR